MVSKASSTDQAPCSAIRDPRLIVPLLVVVLAAAFSTPAITGLGEGHMTWTSFVLGAGCGVLAAKMPAFVRGLWLGRRDGLGLRVMDDDVRLAFEAEVARSRRHLHPLTILVAAPKQGGGKGTQALVQLLDAEVRRADHVVVSPDLRQALVLMPETDHHGAALAVARLEARALQEGLKSRVGTATFPEDAMSIDELVGLAERRLAERPHLVRDRP